MIPVEPASEFVERISRRDNPPHPPSKRLELSKNVRSNVGLAGSRSSLGHEPAIHKVDIMPSTVRLHRVLATSPDKIYRAFVEADALAKWLPPNGFACTVHHLEPKVGGTHKMSFRNFTTGNSHAFGGKYVDLVPGERLRYTDAFD